MTPIALDDDKALNDFANRLAAGEELWVKILRGNRTGAIGKAVRLATCNYDPNQPWHGTKQLYQSWGPKNNIIMVDVFFDKKRKASQVFLLNGHVEWLSEYTGPAVYVPPYAKAEIVAPKDRLGNEIKVGDFGACVLSHHIYNGPALYFVKVAEIKGNKVMVTSIPMSDDERSETQKLNHHSDFVRVDDALIRSLMLKRLSI